MDKNTLIILVLCLAAILLAGCTQKTSPPVTEVTTAIPPTTAITTIPTDTQTCTVDADCVPAQCCHPTSCTNKAAITRACNLMCTTGCTGPLDCGAGSCGCTNGRCSVVPAPASNSYVVTKTSLTLTASPQRYSPQLSSTPGIGITVEGNGFDAAKARFTWNTSYGHFLSWGAVNYTATDVGNPVTNNGGKLYWTFSGNPVASPEPVIITVTATDPVTGHTLGSSVITLGWEGNNTVMVKNIL